LLKLKNIKGIGGSELATACRWRIVAHGFRLNFERIGIPENRIGLSALSALDRASEVRIGSLDSLNDFLRQDVALHGNCGNRL
jgi:hypothetical protein